jgi:MFS family permease
MKLSTKLNLIYLSEFLIFFHLFGGVLIPFFTIWGGLSLSELMMIQAWFSLCVLLFEIPTGTLADTFGRKNTVILSFFTNVIGVILYVVYPTFWMFMLAEMFWALSIALASGAKEAMVYDTLVDHGEEKQSQKVFGKFKMSHLWALMISAPIGSLIGQAWGFEWAVLLMVIPFSLSALILLFVPEPKSHKLPEGQTRKPFWTQIVEGWKYFKTHPYLMVMTFDMVWIWSLAFMIIWFQQVVLLDIGVSESTFGWFVTFGLVSQMVALKSFPFLERILKSKKNVLTLSGILPAVGFFLLAFYPSVATVLIALAFCTGFGLSRRTLYASYVNKFIESHQRATVNSYINIGINITGFIIKPALGFIADMSLFVTFLILGAGCLLVTIFSRVEEKMLTD